jgi:hypothetical protein
MALRQAAKALIHTPEHSPLRAEPVTIAGIERSDRTGGNGANQFPQFPLVLSSQRSRPVGSLRNKTNFCVPLPGSEITGTGNKAFSN